MEKILMGSTVALTAFTLISYILIILNIPFLIIPIILAAGYIFREKIIKEVRDIKITLNRKAAAVLAVFVLGIIGQMAVISPSGRIVGNDLVFWSSHGHDGMWHVALMEEFKRGFPFQNPVLAGEKLVNYHFFSDIAPAIISKYSPGSNLSLDLNLYFRVFPFIFSLLLGSSAFFLAKKMTNNFGSALWATIFTYFAGSFGYVIGKGESVFWATQIQSSSGNPPQIVSDFLLLAFLYYIYDYLKRHNNISFVFSILILGTLAEFKVYAAIVLFGALLLSGLWPIIIPAGIIAAALYLPNSSGTTSFLIFQPWWYIRTMIVEPSRLNWITEELKRQTYVADHNWKRVISIEIVGFLIFFFGNLGMRFVGVWEFIKSSKTVLKNIFNRIFILTIVVSLVLPLLFLQKGVASNTSQFLQYFILLFGILAGISVSKLLSAIRSPVVKFTAAAVLILLMLPTQLGLLTDFYGTLQKPRQAFAKVPGEELAALDFVNRNTDKNSVLVTPEADTNINEQESIPNIWTWADTGYAAAISSRREYFTDKEQVDIMGYDYLARRSIRDTIFHSMDKNLVKQALSETGINLVYYPKELSPKVNLEEIGLTQIFENSSAEVWKIN